MFVTTATARLGSTAMAVGGPLTGTNCIGGTHVVLAVFAHSDDDSNNGVKSIAERLLPPEFATNASA